MFERYTENVRRAIFCARKEAGSLGSPQIDCLHVFLGLLQQSGPMFLAAGLRGTVQGLAEDLRRALPEAREPVPEHIDLPLSNDCKKALSASAAEADRLSGPDVRPAHLALGLMQQCPELALILANHGVERKKLVELARQTSYDDPT